VDGHAQSGIHGAHRQIRDLVGGHPRHTVGRRIVGIGMGESRTTAAERTVGKELEVRDPESR
jgi:hypothetical protein